MAKTKKWTVNAMSEDTGFKDGVEKLFVGDCVSVNSGYCGFMEVVKRNDGYYLTDCTEKVIGHSLPPEELNEDFRLERNLPINFRKVDKNNPFAEPPFPIFCDQCQEVQTGTFDVESGDFYWNKDCAEHVEVQCKDGYGVEVTSKCKLCEADPTRKPPVDEVFEYFVEQYDKAEFRVVPGHWPDFQNKQEVDRWIESHSRISHFIETSDEIAEAD